MKIDFDLKFSTRRPRALKSPTEPLEPCFLAVFKPVEREKNVLGRDRDDAAFRDLVLVDHILNLNFPSGLLDLL